MKNDDFLFSQYEKEVDWSKQEEADINANINKYIIDEIVARKKSDSINLFDMGFGVGFFIEMFYERARDIYNNIKIEGCEPSEKSFSEFKKEKIRLKDDHCLNLQNSFFLESKDEGDSFDVLTSIYVFNCLKFRELLDNFKKISSMLKKKGLFFLVVSSDDCFLERVKKDQDLIVKEREVEFQEKKYREITHYTDLEGLGRIVDCNRKAGLYVDMAKKCGLSLIEKQEVFDNNLISNVLIFEK
jgi:cyclopropane fatty-acyl-phospholipid synthase-like methyltransferase